MDDKEYQQTIIENVQNDKNDSLGNNSETMGKFINLTFIESALNSINILVDKLDDQDILKALEKAALRIGKEGAIKIITIEQTDGGINLFAENVNKKIGIDVIHAFQSTYTGDNLNYYLWFFDGKRYRMQSITKNKLLGIKQATVNCYDPKIVSEWMKYFNNAYEHLNNSEPGGKYKKSVDRICYNCKHCVPNNNLSRCLHPKFIEFEKSLITGEKSIKPILCLAKRTLDDVCGENGLLFEEKL